MKLSKIALAVAGLLSSATVFAASTTHTISVSATIVGNCRFNTAGPTTLTLANSGAVIDQSLGTDATGSANVTYRCTTGTVAATTADNGLFFSGSRRVNDGGTNFMPYALGLAGGAGTGTGHGAGQDLTLTVSGTITAANHQNAAAGTYSDTVILTITP